MSIDQGRVRVIFVLAAVLVTAAQCNQCPPQSGGGTSPTIAHLDNWNLGGGDIHVRAGITPAEGTTVTSIGLQWGRGPNTSLAGYHLYDENYPLLVYYYDYTPPGLIDPPFDDLFYGHLVFRDSWPHPLEIGETVSYQFRVHYEDEEGVARIKYGSKRFFVKEGPASPPDDDVPDDVPMDDVPVPEPQPDDPVACENLTERLSVYTGSGSIANSGDSISPSVSGDGRRVAFSTPMNFDLNDTNNASDVYVHDTLDNSTTWVSVYTGPGSTGNTGESVTPSISADGGHVAFATPMSFDPNDTNNEMDIYVHDREGNSTTWVSVYTGPGSTANTGGSETPSISADGGYVAFATPMSFDPNDTNNEMDIYVHDREGNSTTWVSVYTGGGSIANTGGSVAPSISMDGRHVAFATPMSFDLNDTNNEMDIYVHDRESNSTTWVSVYTGPGSTANTGGSVTPSISADGNYVAFATPMSFDPNDTNNGMDIYVHDRQANSTSWVSIYTGPGNMANSGGSLTPSISMNGRDVAFATPMNFDLSDTNNEMDIYVHDRQANSTSWVSIYTGPGNTQNTGESVDPSISVDGLHVAFSTPFSFDLNDTNNEMDIYKHCR